MIRHTLVLAGVALLCAAPSLAQAPPPAADPGAPLSGYPRKALGLPTAAELKTATYVRDVIYGHRDGMALTYDDAYATEAMNTMVAWFQQHLK